MHWPTVRRARSGACLGLRSARRTPRPDTTLASSSWERPSVGAGRQSSTRDVLFYVAAKRVRVESLNSLRSACPSRLGSRRSCRATRGGATFPRCSALSSPLFDPLRIHPGQRKPAQPMARSALCPPNGRLDHGGAGLGSASQSRRNSRSIRPSRVRRGCRRACLPSRIEPSSIQTHPAVLSNSFVGVVPRGPGSRGSSRVLHLPLTRSSSDLGARWRPLPAHKVAWTTDAAPVARRSRSAAYFSSQRCAVSSRELVAMPRAPRGAPEGLGAGSGAAPVRLAWPSPEVEPLLALFALFLAARCELLPAARRCRFLSLQRPFKAAIERNVSARRGIR